MMMINDNDSYVGSDDYNSDDNEDYRTIMIVMTIMMMIENIRILVMIDW